MEEDVDAGEEVQGVDDLVDWMARCEVSEVDIEPLLLLHIRAREALAEAGVRVSAKQRGRCPRWS